MTINGETSVQVVDRVNLMDLTLTEFEFHQRTIRTGLKPSRYSLAVLFQCNAYEYARY